MSDIVEILERQYARTGLKYMLQAANEIDRLRSELDACASCMKRADAEIERLRGLLLNAPLAELRIEGMKRVREALGE